MRQRMAKATLEKKRKPVAYRFIPPDSDRGQPMYALLRELLDAHHEEVRNARFALAWNLVWKPDVDGRVILGQCKKVTDLEREVFEVAGYDFIVILREEFWTDIRVTDLQRRALLDHELCHAAVKIDEDGEPARDERDRVQYRMRKHDLEEFEAIAERYGCWKRDLESFAMALSRGRASVGTWTGFRRLAEALAAVDAPVPLERIREWNESERREAEKWAAMQRELRSEGVRAGGIFELACPAHVLAALPTRGDGSAVNH